MFTVHVLVHVFMFFFFFFFKQKTAYEIGTGDWSSDVCSSDLEYIQKSLSLMSAKCNVSFSTLNQLKLLISI